jgi:hypothetical protein
MKIARHVRGICMTLRAGVSMQGALRSGLCSDGLQEEGTGRN